MAEQRIIAIEKIVANPYQPRTKFDDEQLYELAQSIRVNGLIQPIVVRELDEHRYEIVAGERRYRAMMMIGQVEVPCLVVDVSDEKSAALALIENIQREDLSAVEEAVAFKEILKMQGITQSELARRLGRSQSAIANKIRLLELPESVLEKLADRSITERHARALLSVDEHEVDTVLQRILDEKLNVKQTEALVQKPKKAKKPLFKGISQNLKIGINTIKQAVMMVDKTGIKVKQEIEENEEEVVMIIRFPK